MMDELRDYRFYAEDMVHPNTIAVQYIWERFRDTWISNDSLSVMKEVDAIRKGLAHRHFDPDSESAILFRERLAQKISALTLKYPFMDFSYVSED
ncbi:hypothetical protein DMZ48_10425 [Robertkochia solimangrovi]|nr:hypothetical protein DMZ48_10425 [Robertkochia solimangrovi]